MIPIFSLWLPILLAAVFVFILSALIHMVFGYHAGDFGKVPGEDAFMDVLRKSNIPPGTYNIPHAGSTKEMNAPGFQEKLKKGPNAIMTIWPGGKMSMGGTLAQWFVYCLLVGCFSAYVSGRALQAGASYLAVFRFAGVTAFACYAIAGLQESIWFMRPWSTTLKNTFDGFVYALVTAGVFGWLWPR